MTPFLDLSAIRQRLAGKERRSVLQEIRREELLFILERVVWVGTGIALGIIICCIKTP